MIWLIGNKGMLGTEVEKALDDGGFDIISSDREVDITDPGVVKTFVDDRQIQGKKIDWIINCSAYTNVDKAEEEEAFCYRLNRDGVKNLAVTAERLQAALLHISTDYVFDGTHDTPYKEEEPRKPLGVYGRSKAAGEEEIERLCTRYLIVRTAWLYGQAGKNFVATMLRLLSEREEVRVINDQRGSPTYAKDFAEALIHLIAHSTEKSHGIYHYSNEDETTWYLFTEEIRKRALALGLLQKAGNVIPIRSDEYPSKVKRPSYSVLSKEKIKTTFGLSIRPWQEGLQAYLEELKSEGVK